MGSWIIMVGLPILAAIIFFGSDHLYKRGKPKQLGESADNDRQ